MELVLSCEHATAAVPPRLVGTLRIPPHVLRSHRGWDAGALPLSVALGDALGIRPIAGTVSRLVVDLNRSANNRRAWSEFALRLDPAARAALIQEHHAPHWESVETAVRAARAPVLHVSVHSFTPVLDGRQRRMDVGLLYDPRRSLEVAVAQRWRSGLMADGLRVARNAPYRGRDDGITRGMRKRFADGQYAGLELEVNQALVEGGRVRVEVAESLCRSLADVLSTAHLFCATQAPTSRPRS